MGKVVLGLALVLAVASCETNKEYVVECENEVEVMNMVTPYPPHLKSGTVTMPDGRYYMIPGGFACSVKEQTAQNKG